MSHDPIPDIDPPDDYDDGRPRIFANRDLLSHQHVPSAERIVGRDEEMELVRRLLNPAAYGERPSNALIFGKTGTGKSLVTKYITGEIRARARHEDVTVVAAYIDCAESNTETRAARQLAFRVRNATERDIHIPQKGIGKAEYYSYLWGVEHRNPLLSEVDGLIVVLDEIDKLADDEILMKLSRAEEAGKTDCRIGIIGISNKGDYGQQMDERVKSSLGGEEHVFSPYDADQLVDILRNRADAFQDGVLSEDAIPMAAALSAQEHGDARQALDILKTAGKLAEDWRDETVTRRHVEAADKHAERSRLQEIIEGSTPQSRYALAALAYLTKTTLNESFSTGDIFTVYEEICAATGTKVLTHQRILELLKEWAFSEVTEHRLTGAGKAEGAYREHTLIRDASMVLDTVFVDSRTREDVIAALNERFEN